MVNQKQLFIDCKLNFNLYNPKGKRPTLIYAVVFFQGKQYRISTGLKIYPKQWNLKRQLASISKRQTELDNYNNSITNKKLRDILFSFEEGKSYLCNHMESLTEFRETLKQYINPNMASRRKKTEGGVAATTQMQLLLSEVAKDSTKSIYQGNLNVFKDFLSKEAIPDTWKNITGDTLEKFKKHMSANGRTVTTVNNCLAGVKIILKKADKHKDINFDFHTSGCDKVGKLKDQRTKDEKKSKQFPLTEEQIQKLHNLELSGKDGEVRDVFVAQCLLGQRISDMSKLFAGNYKILAEDLVEITVQKTGEQAVIYLFPTAKEILEKYKSTGFTYLNIETELNCSDSDKEPKSASYASKINKRIKVICQNAGFNEDICFTEQRGTKKVIVHKKFYELIHTHLARHTFITLMCRMGIDKETVIIATGHEDTKMVDEVYLHTSSLDKAEKLGKAIREKAKGSLFVSNQVEKVVKEKEVDVFNYIFAGDLLLGLAQKYEATKVHEVLDKDLDPGFLELPATKEAVAILKDTTRIGKLDIARYKGNEELKRKVRDICTIVWEIGKAAHDILLIQFFQDNVITLGLNTKYYLPRTMDKRMIELYFEMKPYRGTIIA